MILYSCIIFIFSFLWFSLFKNKYLYKDDGIWFYYANFKKNGILSYKKINNAIYQPGLWFFSIEKLAYWFKKITFKSNNWVGYFKSFLLSNVSLSVFLILFYFSQNIFFSIFNIFLFNFIILDYERKIFVTYAENYQSMFFLLSLFFLFSFPNEYSIIISAILLSIHMHFKITGFINVVTFPLLFLLLGYSFDFVLLYYVIVVIFNFLFPLLIYFPSKRYVTFLIINIRYLLLNINIVLKAIGIKCIFINSFCEWLLNFVYKMNNIEQKQIIVNYAQSRIKSSFLEGIKYYFNNVIKKNEELYFLALFGFIYSIIFYDVVGLALLFLYVNALFIVIIQGGKTISHYNILFPINFVTASYSIWLGISTRNPLFLLLSVILILSYLRKKYQNILKQIKTIKNREIAFYPQRYNAYFKGVEEVASYLKNNSKSNDNLLVWGNLPTIYLRSNIQAFDLDYLLIYPLGVGKIHSMIDNLLTKMKLNPPKWVIFAQQIDKPDQWNIEFLLQKIHIPYKSNKAIEISYKDKKYPPILIYELDEVKYQYLLLEKYICNLVKFEHLKDIINKKLILLEDKISNLLKDNVIDDTINHLQDEIKSNPNFYFYNKLGEIYFKKEDHLRAWECFQKAYQDCQFSAITLNNMGILNFYMGNIQEAVSLLKKAIEFNPDYDDAHQNLNSILAIQSEGNGK